jgi:hypothetical protein
MALDGLTRRSDLPSDPVLAARVIAARKWLKSREEASGIDWDTPFDAADFRERMQAIDRWAEGVDLACAPSVTALTVTDGEGNVIGEGTIEGTTISVRMFPREFAPGVTFEVPGFDFPDFTQFATPQVSGFEITGVTITS